MKITATAYKIENKIQRFIQWMEMRANKYFRQ